ncbi:MAG: VanW family protein [Oscillospiraceae bacterium]|jgi:vancomycin resistance protein YoaR|nr:VanW family protein [Oscillospiraceae bacterium]
MKLTGGKSSRAVKGTLNKKEKYKSDAPKKAKKPKKRGGAKAAVAVLVIVLLVAALALAGVIFVRSRDTVYPNVYLGDVNLGGLTVREATDALRASGYEAAADSARADVGLPNGDIISVTADDAGLRPDSARAAERAYATGRSGGLFSASLAYLKGVLGTKTQLDAGELAALNEAVVRNAVSSAVSRFNLQLANDSFTVNSRNIVIVKGSGSALASEDDVFDLVVATLYSSLAARTPAVAEYDLPPAPEGDGIDLVALYNAVNVEPVSAKYDPETKSVTDSVVGVSFDMTAARAAIDAADTGETVLLPLLLTEPEVTKTALEALLFRDVLAERTTTIDGTSNRLNNITLAAAAIAGLVLNPGEEFSYNGTVGERTTAKGYLSAGAYSGGKTVQEIGGGICQVSSTIYDCVLHADLKVTARRNHQFIVTYLPLGNDATVNWGTTDFKFQNSSDYPLRIDTLVEGRKLTVKLIGTKLDENSIKIEYNVLSQTGFSVVEMEDESIAPGTSKVDTSGHGGYVVETYKYRYDGSGALINKEFVSKSTYNSQNRIILVPVGTLTSPTPEDPTATEDPSVTPPEETDNPYAPPTDAPPTEGPFDTPPPSVTPPTETPAETPTETPAETPANTPPSLPDDPINGEI